MNNEKQYAIRVTVKKGCLTMIHITQEEGIFTYRIPQDLVSNVMSFTEIQYCKAKGVIIENTVKALIRKQISIERGIENPKITFISLPDWVEIESINESSFSEERQPTFKVSSNDNIEEVLSDGGNYEKYYD